MILLQISTLAININLEDFCPSISHISNNHSVFCQVDKVLFRPWSEMQTGVTERWELNLAQKVISRPKVGDHCADLQSPQLSSLSFVQGSFTPVLEARCSEMLFKTRLTDPEGKTRLCQTRNSSGQRVSKTGPEKP